MAQFLCVIQEDRPAATATTELESGLHEVHREHFGEESTDISWWLTSEGEMFTEGRPSTTSIIAPVIAAQTTIEQRERYMRAICDMWTGITGCTDHEVLVAITETDSTD